MIRALQVVGWILFFLLATGVALYAYYYFAQFSSSPPDAAATGIPAQIRDRPLWFFMHVGGGATALLLSPWQFVGGIRNRWPVIHRYVGRLYVAAVFAGGLAGLVLALNSDAGLIAQSGFGLLAILWLTVTLAAFVQGWRRKISFHRNLMIRSAALTFAAVTLRLYLPLTFIFFEPNYGIGFDITYPAIAWLCWAPNLIIAEWIVRRWPYGGE